jgi:hypothetical protein
MKPERKSAEEQEILELRLVFEALSIYRQLLDEM